MSDTPIPSAPPSDPPVTPMRRPDGFADDFRRFFQRGLAALLPTLITVLLLLKVWEILWNYLGQHILNLLGWLNTNFLHGQPWEEQLSPWHMKLIGVLLAIVLVYIVGLFVGHFLGRAAWRLAELGVMRIPLIRAIYPAVKQVTDFVLAERHSTFSASRVVAIQPHAGGIWSVGLITGPGIAALAQKTGDEMLTVFVPSSPTAFTGYVVLVPRRDVVQLPLSVEEAMRLLMTGGVSTPTGIPSKMVQ